jgi:hypothetical protein
MDNMSRKIRECYERAKDCARQADAQSDSTTRKEFLIIAEGWLVLARSYEFAKQLTRSTF